jgi:hypothetical protein
MNLLRPVSLYIKRKYDNEYFYIYVFYFTDGKVTTFFFRSENLTDHGL